jgi:hypothetical protein
MKEKQVKLTENTPSSDIPADLMAQIYARVAGDIFTAATVGAPAKPEPGETLYGVVAGIDEGARKA